jgi:hypothetical protein
MTVLADLDPRETEWRQGFALNPDAARSLGLDDALIYLVISHDCDLAASVDNEPKVEIIAGEVLDSPNGLNLYARNPRLLHLPVTYQGQKRFLAITPCTKQLLDKVAVLGELPNQDLQLSGDELRLLRSWLACRYRRHALPNELNDRLSRVYSKLEGAGKKKPDGVIATFLAYDPADSDLPADVPYEVKFWVIFESQHPEGETNASLMAKAIGSALENNEGVESEVKVVADTAFTLFDMNKMVEWRLEHLSFRGQYIGRMLEP